MPQANMNEDLHAPPPKEKKRRRDDKGKNSIAGSSDSNSMKISLRNKRNGPSTSENEKEEVDNNATSTPDSKKERGSGDRHTHTSKRKTSRPAEDTEINADAKKKKKKRKREVDSEDESRELKVDPPFQEGKTRTRFPNPSKDEGLTEQACKALSYAYMQHKHPSTWKFNKARQNWLLRNWWNEKTIIDVHMPLVAQYLANVQGGVKENLVKACHAHLTSGPRPDEPQATSENNQLASPGTEKTAEQIRSKVLLEALSVT